MRVALAIALVTMVMLAGCFQSSTGDAKGPGGSEPRTSTDAQDTPDQRPADPASADTCPTDQDDLDGDGL